MDGEKDFLGFSHRNKFTQQKTKQELLEFHSYPVVCKEHFLHKLMRQPLDYLIDME